MAGQPRNRLARLNPNGTLDATFTSDANGTVESLAVQPDGNILVGGSFAALAGQLRLRMARLINTDTATQSLTQTNSTITWLRGGSSPEVWRTAFEHAMDGTNWTLLGAGTRMLGGWQLTNVSLPPGGTLRARGWLAGGERNSAGCFVDSHHGDPIMVSQPASRTNQANTTARFWVVTGGSEPLNHQWLKNGIPLTDGTNVSGVASPTITLSAVFKSDEGNYQLRISNSFGSVTSTVASLTVLEPLITVQPMGTNRLVGESMTFSVAAAGTPPLQYQWYREGTALLGATDALLTLTNLMTTDAGYYYVRVSNAFGLVASLQTPLSINGLNAETGFNPGPNALVQSLAIQPDAKILVGGRFTTLAGQSRDRLGRLHPDGSLDTAFNPGASATVRCLALQADGEILVGGDFTTLGGQPRSYLGRLHPDGTLDTNFNPVANGSVSSLVWQPDGKILVGGFFTMLSGQPRSRIARIQQDGTPDMTFDPGADNLVECLTLQSDGKILVGGQFTTLGGQPRSRIGRLQPNGTLESIFNPGAGGTVSCVAQQSDGKILVAGSFLTLGSQDRRYLGRLLQNGTLDTTFAPSPNMRARSLAMQTDGKILAGGEFTSLGGQPRSYLGRLLPDGQLDPTFNPGASDNVYSLALQADGKILMGGSFSMLAGQTLSPLGRLNNNDMATQHLAYDGSAIIWQRGGGGPEVGRTSFEHSSDGSNWVFLGVGTRLVGGWQLTGVSLPSVGTLRARGYVAGSENDSGWFVESTLSAPWPIRVRLVHLGSSVVLSWVGGQGPFQVQQATYLDLPISWQDIGAPVDTNSVSLPAGPGPLFLRVREP